MVDEVARARLASLLEGEGRAASLAAEGALERDVAAVREREMRRVLLAARLVAVEVEELVAMLVVLMGRVDDGAGRAREVLQEIALEPSVFTQFPYERVAAAYALARALGNEAVARKFLSVRPPGPDAQAEPKNDHLDLPLGLRRAAARATDRLVLDRLLHDRDERVVALLLDNPRVVERDVVRIAAMRPTRPAVLECVARHRRWSSNYRVRVALACNRASPSTVTLRLLPTLMRQDVRRALDAGLLDGAARAEARRMLGLDDASSPAVGVGGIEAEAEALAALLEEEG